MDLEQFFDKLQKDNPHFHSDGKGGLTAWCQDLDKLHIMSKYIVSDRYSLETGSGWSTLLFIKKRSFHTCIVPFQSEVDRITRYCHDNSWSLDRTKFIVKDSTEALPLLNENHFDFFFIDGAHRFPFPIVDWFYGTKLLKLGGVVVVDDIDIISCYLIHKFMQTDPHWEMLESHSSYSIFKKLGNHDYPGEWPGQPFSRIKVTDRKKILEMLFG